MPCCPHSSTFEILFNKLLVIRTPSREGAGCPFKCAAFWFTTCPVSSCPACEPNSGSISPSLSTKAHSSRGGPTLLRNQEKFGVAAASGVTRAAEKQHR